MEITHILRADEWLASVPLHVRLYQAFGWDIPIYAHLPVILDPGGKGKMSKRKTVGPGGQTYHVLVRDFREGGFLPEAMFNFLALLGWSYDDQTELMSRDELVERFVLDRVRPAPSAFSYDKLEWMNGVYIRQLSPDDLADRLAPYLAQGLGMDVDEVRSRPELVGLPALVQERLKTLTDIVDWADFFFKDDIGEIDPALYVSKKVTMETAVKALKASLGALRDLALFDEASVEAAMRELSSEVGIKLGPLLGPVRVAVTGKKVAPPLFGTLAVLGQERTVQRLEVALSQLPGQEESA
jgi:glutamyl-tRNA synthetase